MNLHKRAQFTYKTRGNLSDAYNFRETTGTLLEARDLNRRRLITQAIILLAQRANYDRKAFSAVRYRQRWSDVLCVSHTKLPTVSVTTIKAVSTHCHGSRGNGRENCG